jgi:hypothetical protein
MERMKAAMIIAFACCFLLAHDLAMARRPSPNFSLEFRVTDPEVRSRPDVVVVVRIGMDGIRRLPAAEWDLAGMTEYFGLWRQLFMEKLFKRLHMA